MKLGVIAVLLVLGVIAGLAAGDVKRYAKIRRM